MAEELTARQANALCRDADRLLREARALLAEHGQVRDEVGRALGAVREQVAMAELAAIPVARLKDVTGGRLRIGTLERSGYTTVLQVLQASPYTLQLLPGIGARTAGQVHAAARQIARAAADAASVRLEIPHHQAPEASGVPSDQASRVPSDQAADGRDDARDRAATELVIALHRLVDAGPDLPRGLAVARGLDERLAPMLAEARPARRWLRMLLTGPARRRRAREALVAIEGALEGAKETRLLLAQVTTDLLRPPLAAFEAWADFESRSSDYYSLLGELAGEPAATGQGALPDDLLAKVNAQELDDTHRRVSLRGYQSFGARFALAQRRVIVGDEMGLGKSIEAIAALAHLKAGGADHFLVVCPASVLINWVREITARSTLRAVPVHGSERPAAQREWLLHGGVAVVTLDSLHRLVVPPEVSVGMLVVDEAHYVKNPQTKRSKAVAAWCRRVERVLFLTGTPMENRVEEFRVLVSYLQPELAAGLRGSDAVAGARSFRRAVAPAYLRRNQQDVLAELPDLVEAQEWVEFTGDDAAAYRQAVADGNFMAMRRAGFAVPGNSAKLKRLLELVDDARVNGLKVIVFSYFRDVLTSVETALKGGTHGPNPSVETALKGGTHGPNPGVEAALGDGTHGPNPGALVGGAPEPSPGIFGSGGGVHGPISGGLTPARRQQVVDAFTAAKGHAVLLGQVQAGGVGLNLQAASVVIMCEPQVKPSTEAQAVARAHRMGQVRKVQVHRLLAVDTVDQRLLDILEAKAQVFDAYARRSDLAESSPEAIDISEQALARQIIEEEQRRLAL